MTQIVALIIDAYRDLNARKLFWITMILSGAVIVAIAFVGVSGTSLTFAGYHMDVSPFDPLAWYKWGFSYIVVGIWLSWAAVILALISAGGMFPDLLSSGAIDLYLSKPISRLKLFLVKYFTGLLFVALQVAVFSAASFILFGIRAHEWKPSLFLAIPIVVCMFSYIFAFCVLLGVWTRSTIAAILLTLPIWFGFFGIQWTENKLVKIDVLVKNQIEHNKKFLASADAELAAARPSTTQPSDSETAHISMLTSQRQQIADREPDLERNYSKLHLGYNIAHGIKTIIPKTTETNDLLDRWLFTDTEVNAAQENRSERRRERSGNADGPMGLEHETIQQSSEELQGIVRHTSLWYIIGTSLLCEAVVVGFAAWIFCRRDY